MRKYDNVRALAAKLRREGRSLDDLCVTFPMVPRTTLYYWIQKLPRPVLKGAKNQQAASRAFSEKARRRREEWSAEARTKAPALLADPLFRDFVCAFACEGSRKETDNVAVVNTDPALIRLCARALRLIAEDKPLLFELRLYSDHTPAVEADFWASELGISPRDIVIRQKASHGLRVEKSPSSHGIMRVRILSTKAKLLVDECQALLKKKWC